MNEILISLAFTEFATTLLDANPGKFIVIAVNNSGQYSQPTAGWANLESSFGSRSDIVE